MFICTYAQRRKKMGKYHAYIINKPHFECDKYMYFSTGDAINDLSLMASFLEGAEKDPDPWLLAAKIHGVIAILKGDKPHFALDAPVISVDSEDTVMLHLYTNKNGKK